MAARPRAASGPTTSACTKNASPVFRVTRAVKHRRERSAALDIEALVAEKAVIRASGAADRFGEVGCWHTEPGPFRRPSEADLETWTNGLELARPGGCSRYLGLIMTDATGDGRWSRVEAHAFVLRHSLGRVVCEPAAVDGGKRRRSKA